ncbi:hypothetical protein [Phosphitispora fastidiosa]|uniref:hypothetical protein n=1 Tax=Phosphitispora fastidiosa TaxID=2837202 RepID=UPI001E5EDFEB|nr:hypothetical protein [Phosphitispora fastidiosa]MBU7006183.1 putative nucleic acid-binding Zn-ribbon protein [Phosphitispora fastidiosa]
MQSKNRKTSESTGTNNSENHNIDLLKRQLKNVRAVKDKLEKKVAKMANQLTELRKAKKDLELKVRLAQLKVTKMTEDISTRNQILSERQRKVTELTEKIKSLQREIGTSSDKCIEKENKHLEYRRKKVTEDNRRLRQMNQELKEQINFLEEEVRKLQSNDLNQDNLKLRNKLNEALILANSFRRKYYSLKREIEKGYPVSKLLFLLDEKLGMDNITEYEPLYRLLSKMIRMKKFLRSHTRHIAKRNNNAVEVVMGYILYSHEQHWFASLNGQAYRLDISPEELGATDDLPASAVISNGKARIKTIYPFEHNNDFSGITPTVNRSRKHKESNSKCSDDRDEFRGIKILIVGSRNKEKYSRALSDLGANVTWHNPYEDGENALMGKLSSANVVILCQRHIPHGILDSADITDPRVELVSRDNVTVIIARIRFVLVTKLHLISIG